MTRHLGRLHTIGGIEGAKTARDSKIKKAAHCRKPAVQALATESLSTKLCEVLADILSGECLKLGDLLINTIACEFGQVAQIALERVWRIAPFAAQVFAISRELFGKKV